MKEKAKGILQTAKFAVGSLYESSSCVLFPLCGFEETSPVPLSPRNFSTKFLHLFYFIFQCPFFHLFIFQLEQIVSSNFFLFFLFYNNYLPKYNNNKNVRRLFPSRKIVGRSDDE